MSKRLSTLVLTIFFIFALSIPASATGYNIEFNLNHKDGEMTLTLDGNDIQLNSKAADGMSSNMSGEFPEVAESIVKYFKSQNWEKDENYDPNKPGYELRICPENGFCETYYSNNMPRDLIDIENSELFTMLEESLANFIKGIFKFIGIAFVCAAIFFVVILVIILKAVKNTAKMSTEIIRDVNNSLGGKNIAVTRTVTRDSIRRNILNDSHDNNSSSFAEKERNKERRNNKNNPFEL